MIQVRTKILAIELFGLFVVSLVAFAVGVCTETSHSIGLHDYFKDIDWLLAAFLSVPLSLVICLLYFFQRNFPQRWLIFLVAPLVRYFFGAILVRTMIY